MNWWDYPNFEAREFTCKHTGRNKMSADFLTRLQRLRTKYGKPMVISSGYRDPSHPIEAGKPGGPGPHSAGRACDVVVSGADTLLLTVLAVQEGFTGIGWMQKGGSRFIHLDDLPGDAGRPRPFAWSY
jgi:zinc D-Ala-D-Ala carboxypeptidase